MRSLHNFEKITNQAIGLRVILLCEENAVVTGKIVVAVDVDDVEVVVAVVEGAAATLYSCCTSSDTSERLLILLYLLKLVELYIITRLFFISFDLMTLICSI